MINKIAVSVCDVELKAFLNFEAHNMKQYIKKSFSAVSGKIYRYGTRSKSLCMFLVSVLAAEIYSV